MRQLIFKSIAAATIVIGWYLFIVYVDMRNDVLDNKSNYLAAIVDKTELLKKSSPEKILLLGGSNLAFGVDSQKMHELTGKAVINMGLHGGTGLNFMFKLSKDYIYKGDIVLCSPEYVYFTSDKFYGDSFLVDSLYYLPTYRHLLLDLPQVYSIVEKNIMRNNELRKRGLENIFKQPEFVKDVYYREGFNEYGDVVSHLNKPNREYTPPTSLAQIDPLFINKLSKFKKMVEAKGAVFVFAYPCFPASQYEANAAMITSIHAALVAANIAQHVSPEDFVFKDNCFFDTAYHLNAACRDKRTELLVNLLNQVSPVKL